MKNKTYLKISILVISAKIQSDFEHWSHYEKCNAADATM